MCINWPKHHGICDFPIADRAKKLSPQKYCAGFFTFCWTCKMHLDSGEYWIITEDLRAKYRIWHDKSEEQLVCFDFLSGSVEIGSILTKRCWVYISQLYLVTCVTGPLRPHLWPQNRSWCCSSRRRMTGLSMGEILVPLKNILSDLKLACSP
jgi:hypothetical protein